MGHDSSRLTRPSAVSSTCWVLPKVPTQALRACPPLTQRLLLGPQLLAHISAELILPTRPWPGISPSSRGDDLLVDEGEKGNQSPTAGPVARSLGTWAGIQGKAGLPRHITWQDHTCKVGSQRQGPARAACFPSLPEQGRTAPPRTASLQRPLVSASQNLCLPGPASRAQGLPWAPSPALSFSLTRGSRKHLAPALHDHP